MTTGPSTGSEVLLQDEVARTCKGFVEVGFSRPARILVHSGGSVAARANAAQLVEGLDRVLRGLGAGRPHSPPCGGELFPTCMAADEPHTLNLLVWVALALVIVTCPPSPPAGRVCAKTEGRCA